MKIDRRIIFEKYNGKCAYCGVELDFNKFQIDHFESKYRNNYFGKDVDNSLDNLMPSCPECNRYKSSGTLETFRTNLAKSKKQLLKTQNLRILNRLGGFSISSEPIKFYFEY